MGSGRETRTDGMEAFSSHVSSCSCTTSSWLSEHRHRQCPDCIIEMGFLFPLKKNEKALSMMLACISPCLAFNSGLHFLASVGEIHGANTMWVEEKVPSLAPWAFGSRQESHPHKVTLRGINLVLTGLLMAALPTYHMAF